jgi:hypothetical protein
MDHHEAPSSKGKPAMQTEVNHMQLDTDNMVDLNQGLGQRLTFNQLVQVNIDIFRL